MDWVDRMQAAADLDLAGRIARARRPARERQLRRGARVLCRACGEPIAAARLAALPEAARCLACQARRERTHQGALP